MALGNSIRGDIKKVLVLVDSTTKTSKWILNVSLLVGWCVVSGLVSVIIWFCFLQTSSKRPALFCGPPCILTIIVMGDLSSRARIEW